MTKRDCIIVLGGSPDPRIFSPRVDKAIELWRQGAAPVLVLSGKYWALRDPKPAETEAALMKSYALERGVPEDAILTEENSLDTIGNIFFTKRDILEPHNWRSFLIISTDYHEQRLRYIMEKLLGPEYLYEFVGVPPTNITEEQLMINKEVEGKSMEKMEKFFAANPELDVRNTKELEKHLYAYHPYYSR